MDGRTVVVCPLVSRHFDFLDGLWSGAAGQLPLAHEVLYRALSHTILLLGSAPVGPTTVARLQKCAGKLPTVRFGSTETCLQVRHQAGPGPIALIRPQSPCPVLHTDPSRRLSSPAYRNG